MENLNYYKDIIKKARKQTDFKDFLEGVASWYPVAFSKNSGIISRFPESERVNVTSIKEFNKARDTLINNGVDYDSSAGFYSCLQKLFQEIKLPNLLQYGVNENCEFSDIVLYSKNAYLSTTMIGNCENVFYSIITRNNSRNIFNSIFSVENSENIYFCLGVLESYNVFYSRYINNSNNIWFSSNLHGCRECILCSDLDNSSYHIENKKYNKEEYFKKKEEILQKKSNFSDLYSKVGKVGKNSNAKNSSGSFITDSEDIKNGHLAYNSKSARNTFFIGSVAGNSNFFDVVPGGGGSVECSDFYGVSGAGDGCNNIYYSSQIGSSSNIFYSYYLEGCSYCIGCIGLQNKSYCILNKQYEKNEWNTLSIKILSQLNNDGDLEKFIPGKLNPFYFNDTMASILGNFKKEDVEKKGYMWRDTSIKTDIPERVSAIKNSKLGDFEGFINGNWNLDKEILNKIIVDEKGNYYRIMKMEFDFLLKYQLPLPRLHWIDRMKVNFGVKY